MLSGDNPLATVRLPQRGLSSQSLASTDNLTRTTKRQNIQQQKLTLHNKKGPNKQQYSIKHAKIYERHAYDMYHKPVLVAFYDIWPGNGAGLFLQPGTRTGLMLHKRTQLAPQSLC